MRIVEILETRRQAMRVSEVANLFCVTPQHIYKMAANGHLPSLRIAGPATEFLSRTLAFQLPFNANRRSALPPAISMSGNATYLDLD
jgi:excisionase family DNA binding protein